MKCSHCGRYDWHGRYCVVCGNRMSSIVRIRRELPSDVTAKCSRFGMLIVKDK